MRALKNLKKWYNILKPLFMITTFVLSMLAVACVWIWRKIRQKKKPDMFDFDDSPHW